MHSFTSPFIQTCIPKFNNLIHVLSQILPLHVTASHPQPSSKTSIKLTSLNDIQQIVNSIHLCYFNGTSIPPPSTTYLKTDLHCLFMVNQQAESQLQHWISKVISDLSHYKYHHFRNMQNVGHDCSQLLKDLQASVLSLFTVAVQQPQSIQIISPPSSNSESNSSAVSGGGVSKDLNSHTSPALKAVHFVNDLENSSNLYSPNLNASNAINNNLTITKPKPINISRATRTKKDSAINNNEFTSFVAYYINKIDHKNNQPPIIEKSIETNHLNSTPNIEQKMEGMNNSSSEPNIKSTDTGAQLPTNSISNLKDLEDGTLESALAAHDMVMASQLKHLTSTCYNTSHKTLPSSFESSTHCRQITEAINLLRDPSIFCGMSALNRSKLMRNAQSRTSFQQKLLKQTLKDIAMSQGLDLTDPLKVPKVTPYNLRSLPINGRKRAQLRVKLNDGAHLSPEAAFNASLSDLTMTQSMAILDSGASKHFMTTFMRSKLLNRRNVPAVMYNANGVKTELTEGGDFKLKLSDSTGQTVDSIPLNDISIVPDATFNLISLTRLFETGAKFELAAEGCYLKFNGRKFPLIIQRGLLIIDLNTHLCALDNDDDEEHAYSATQHDIHSENSDIEHMACAAASAPLKVWHDRLGHASNARIKFLHSSGTALGMNLSGSITHDSKCSCEACLKTNNVSHGISSSRQFSDCTSRKGQIITTDCLGPFPRSVEGYQYAISFTDEYSRFSVVYLLKRKSDAAEAVDTLARYYRSMNLTISEIRHDQGGEFGGITKSTTGQSGTINLPTSELIRDVYSKSFKAACRRNQIIPHPMPAYKPQLHGIAERWNRTVTTIANSMMYNAKISPILWASAILHANTIRNYLPTRSRSGFTPQELFTNQRPRYENFRIWGCYCYKKLPVFRKLPGLPVRKRLIYLGDSPDSVGFRCIDPQTYKITTEFELIFDEDSVKRRSTLLEAYDNRRNIIGNNDKVEGIPLVADLDHSSTEERALFKHNSNDTMLGPNNLNQHRTTESLNDASSNLITDTTLKDKPSSGGAVTSTDDRISAKIHTGDSTTTDEPPASHNKNLFPSPSKEQDAVKSSVTPSSTPSLSTHSDTTGLLHNGIKKPGTEGSLPASPSPSHLNTREERSDRGNGLKPSTSTNRLNLHPITSEGFDIDLDDINLLNDQTPLSSPKSQSHNSDPNQTVTALPRNHHSDLSGDEFELNQDAEAEKFGPLIDENLRIELALNKFDLTPGHLRCPTRYLKYSQPEEVPEELDSFLRLASLENLPIQISPKNPKTGDSAKRYDIYKKATSVLDFYNICKHHRLGKSRADFKNDYLRGYITFPYNTQTRDDAHSAYYACVASSSKSPINQTAGDAELLSTQLPSTSSFNELIKELWPHDHYASDEELREQSLNALAMVTALLAESAVLPSTPEPTSYKKAVDINNPEREFWIASIKRELDTLIDRNTWSYVDKHLLPRGRKPIRCKYVFKRKFNKDGTIQYKTRLVACGVTQRPGLDYSSEELYASVCSYSSMRFLMSLATQNRMLLYQTDIQGAYLEAYLDDEIYMHNPEGIQGHNNQFCRLVRGLYGCKQSGWAWSQCFKEFMTADPKYNMEFVPMTGEPNLYRKSFTLNGVQEEIFVGQYVDDCLVAASSTAALDWYNSRLKQRFPVNPKSSGYISKENPGLLLSMQVKYDFNKGELTFNQSRAIDTLARKYDLNASYKSLLPLHATNELPKLDAPEDPSYPSKYLSMIGSCLHICQVSRPDCSYAVGVLARHSSTPGIEHMKAAENLIKYLYHTRDWSIRYRRTDSDISNTPYIYEKSSFPRDKSTPNYKDDMSSKYKYAVPPRTIEERLTPGYTPVAHPNHPLTYIDANLAGDRITRKSTSGLVIMMNGGPITWCSRLQKLCAQSSAESEIIAVVDSVKEALHIKLLCEESGIRPPNIPMEVQEDNNACIHLAHNLRGSQQAKHYELRLRFLNEHVLEKNIEFSRVDTTQQLADGFTKPLAMHNFRIFRNWMLYNPAALDTVETSTTT